VISSKTNSFCSFLVKIRRKNPEKKIAIVLDNFRSHKTKKAQILAKKLKIILVFLPPYSPDLNPIEYIWKSLKRAISPKFIASVTYFEK